MLAGHSVSGFRRCLWRGLSDEAQLNRDDPEQPYWGYTHELLAQVIEEHSLTNVPSHRKEPITVTRPNSKRTTNASAPQESTVSDVPTIRTSPHALTGGPSVMQTASGGQRAVGLEGMLAMAGGNAVFGGDSA